MPKKSRSIVTVAMAMLVIVTAILGIFVTMSGILSEKRTIPSGFFTETDGETPPIFTYHALNVSVADSQGNALKNVWVVVFDENNIAKTYGYTDDAGTISFQLLPNDYVVQFEKYHYVAGSEQVTIDDEDVRMMHTLQEEPVVLFGSIPSWMIMSLIGFVVLGLAYWNRHELKLGGFRKQDYWFGSSTAGSWTFLEKTTKSALYGISFILLIILLVVVLPNFPTFNDMAIYYVAIGAVSVMLLFMEGSNRRFPIAAIGFGKISEALGNIVVGAAFAMIFIGLTGFITQLCIPSFSIPAGSIISILMVVLVASYFETMLFLGIIAPTIAEKSGMLPSIVITSILFMFAHSLAYGLAFVPMLSAFIFNAPATMIVLQRKSWLGIFIAHAVINALSVFSIMLFS